MEERVAQGQVGFEATTMEPRLSRATFVALGVEAEPNSLHLVLDEREIADIKTCCVHEAVQASFFRWLSTSPSPPPGWTARTAA